MKTYFNALLLMLICLYSCKKDFLDKKPFSNKNVPTTLASFREILDNENIYFLGGPTLGELSSDDYLIATDVLYNTLFLEKDKNTYIWNKNIYTDLSPVADWNLPYQQIFYANTVLEGLNNIPINPTNEKQHHTLKGEALFLRAYAFYNLTQVFSPVYDASDSDNPYGIPLRLTTDINLKTSRAKVKDTYEQIIADVKESVKLLPEVVQSQALNRPTKPAAFAFLARIYLSMRDYHNAGINADSSLRYHNKLIDYNTVSTVAPTPFLQDNKETLYQSAFINNASLLIQIQSTPGYTIPPQILQSYHNNDLRKIIFFTNTGNVKNNYSGNINRFNGLATDEVYLIRAECLARAQKVTAAMKDLNDLLRTRWKKNPDGTTTYVDYVASNADEALNIILTERRKELIIRGLRWSDLRRLNKEGRNITLSRVINGITYTLPANDPRYVLPIPQDVINLTGITQNPR